MADYQAAADQIVKAIGGKENIDQATHCVTRLRFVLKDEGKVDEKALEQIEEVKGSFSANGQYQVVIGQGVVNRVYAEMVKRTGIGEATKEDVKRASDQKLNPLQRAVKTLADIFIPIPVMCLILQVNRCSPNPFRRTC